MNKKQINLVKTSAKNIIQFSHFIKILTEHGLDKFKPYKHQRDLLRKFAETGKLEYTGKRNHIIIGPRQCGKTTIIAIYILWYMIFNTDKNVALVTTKVDMGIEILARIKEMYAMLPDFIKPTVIKNTKEIFKFENRTAVLVISSHSNSIHGRSIDLMVIDEAARITKSAFEDFIRSVFPTQASRPDAQMIMISTPHGVDHQFYNIWTRALEERNSFIPTKIKWNCAPYRDNEWKEQIIRNYGQAFFNQEYACEFIGSN